MHNRHASDAILCHARPDVPMVSQSRSFPLLERRSSRYKRLERRWRSCSRLTRLIEKPDEDQAMGHILPEGDRSLATLHVLRGYGREVLLPGLEVGCFSWKARSRRFWYKVFCLSHWFSINLQHAKRIPQASHHLIIRPLRPGFQPLL